MQVNEKGFMGFKGKIEDLSNYMSKKKYLDRSITDYGGLPQEVFEKSEPVFVLSTGRCGTKLLTKLFETSVNWPVHHEPNPRMIYASRYAYENIDNGIEIRKSSILSGRYELLRDAYLKGKRYIETNNQLSFFADAILELMPMARFIHLIRHPGDFVRSGIRRNYYIGHDYDDGRIYLKDNQLWDSYSQIQKVGWLWNETNAIIEQWKETTIGNNVITVKSEHLFTDPSVFRSICDFVDIPSPADNKIKQVIERPVNVQTKGNFPKYDKWRSEQKKELYLIAPLGKIYGYLNDSNYDCK